MFLNKQIKEDEYLEYDNNENIVLVNNITNNEDYDKESTNTEISYL